MDSNKLELVKLKLLELLVKMGIEAQIFERLEEGRTVLNIKTFDSKLLIGRQGSNLEALQYMLYLLLRKDLPAEDFPFALDVDDYKDQRSVYLKELARKAAHQVRDTKRSVALPAMSSQERRVVHNYLSLFSDLSSESIGIDPGRRVVIRIKSPAYEDGSFKFIENS